MEEVLLTGGAAGRWKDPDPPYLGGLPSPDPATGVGKGAAGSQWDGEGWGRHSVLLTILPTTPPHFCLCCSPLHCAPTLVPHPLGLPLSAAPLDFPLSQTFLLPRQAVGAFISETLSHLATALHGGHPRECKAGTQAGVRPRNSQQHHSQ